MQVEIGVVDRDGFNKGRDDRECRKRRSPNCEALPDGRCGVAYFIQAISNFPSLRAHTRHLGDAACVVRYGAVGVNRHGDTDGGQHADCRDTHAIKAGEVG